jgi:adenine-specific DNA-methyltransferase
MALIEELIKTIADPRLRDQVAGEVAKLKAKKKFGLVFEEHLPEVVQLPGLAVKPGARVAKRGDKAAGFFVVRPAVNGKRVSIVPERGGPEEVAAKDDLVVVKRFGEPMYPALIPVDTVERAPGKPWHVLINADNYHALQLLLYGYEGKVDVIYIDPPYNTGARDWKYNNDYVDSGDQFRHSKWLSMMKKRLALAKRLLHPTEGVLIVTIDEHEVHHLGTLLEETFPEHYRQMVTIVINQKGVAQGRLSRAEEYAIFCFGPEAAVIPQEDDLLSPDRADTKRFNTPRWEWLLRGGTNSRREDRPKLFFPIYIDPAMQTVTRIGEPLPLDKKPNMKAKPARSVAWPIRTDGSLGNWRVSPPTLRELVAKGYVKLGGYDEKRQTWTILYLGQRAQQQIEAGEIAIVTRDLITNAVDVAFTSGHRRQIKTVWHRAAHDAGNYGSSLLRNLLGEGASFAFPKSLYAVRDTLKILLAEKPNAIVLDFFAGSGTTLHALSLLNADDQGNRRCIVVTNNEAGDERSKALTAQGIQPDDDQWEREGITESVTWPRIKACLSGQRPDGSAIPGEYLDARAMSEGFEENAAYFKLDFLDPAEVTRGDKFESIVPILWTLAGCRGACDTSRGSGKWYLPKRNPFAVLLKEDVFGEFIPKLAERTDIEYVFLVTDSTETFHEMQRELGKKYRCIQLYRSYIDTFRINLIEPGTISPGGVPVQPTPTAGPATTTEGGA